MPIGRCVMSIVVVAGLIGMSHTSFAQEPSTAPSTATSSPRVTDAQLDGLYARLMGTWRLNAEKSVFIDEPPQLPYGFIYNRVGKNGVRYTSSDGDSIQYYDGKVYATAVKGETVARTPLDALTVDNVTRMSGKITSHRTQYLSADGKVMLSVVRKTNEHGEEVPSSFRILEKVPDGTPVFAPKTKP